MVRPQAITDHTTLFKRRSWAGRPDGRSNADPLVEIDSMTTTERRLVSAFKQALGDHKTHKLSRLMLRNDIKDLTAELKLPHTKVRHILKNIPKEIMFFEDAKSGQTYLALKQTSTSTAPTTSQPAQAGPSRQDSRGPSITTQEANAQQSGSLFRSADMSSDNDNDSATSDSGFDRSARRDVRAQEKAARRHSESTWGMQRPQERQLHTREVASASVSPQKKEKGVQPKPRQSAPVTSTSAYAQHSTPFDTQREGSSAIGGGISEDEEDLLRAIRQSLSAVPPSQSQRQDGDESDLPPPLPLRKQPAPPPAKALREVAVRHGLDFGHGNDSAEQADTVNDEEGSNMALDVDGNGMKAASSIQNGQEEYGIEIPIEQVASQAGPSRLQADTDEDDFDLDMTAVRRSASVKSHHRTSSGGGSARKEMPDQMFDGYKATRARGRSVRPGPPGMDEASTRDSSVQDAESMEEQELDDEKPEVSKSLSQKRGPTKPGRRHVSDGSSSDDVIVVTSVRVGAPPPKTREEREAEREERRKLRKEKELKKLEKEKIRKKRERNPLPTFRHTSTQEANELELTYKTFLKELAKAKQGTSVNIIIDLDAEEDGKTTTQQNLPDLATVASENSSWTQMFSYASLKGKGNRPDYNTVKFWPYNLPFPGRQKNEAIVAVAGGCVVRVFRLSETRGVTELWNTIDESVNWDEESWRENFYTCAWTHDERRDRNIAPHWRKWPILCVAGKGKEIKILDGYSGATLKIIQGHGGPIYSLAVHPSLPHVIATASGDEAISLWDISVPVAKPEAEAGHGSLDEADKRRKGYVEGERLCVFGGYAGHVEAVLSIAIHPSSPLLVSGGGDCKLRIWRLPNDLPTRPSSSLTEPTPIDPPEKSRRPASYAFPIFTQTSLHSHHIDHVEWIGHDGHILTRTLCYNAPGKRVIRLFRPTFFDTLSSSSAKPQDIVGFGVDFPSKVELLARWTTPSCSGGIGDGVVCTANEIVSRQDGELTTRRRIYVPSIEPAVHIYDLDLKTKQPDLEALVHEYPFKLGDEMLFEEDKGKKGALKAVDCQTAGRGWLVAVGEGEKIMVWHRKESETWLKTQKDLRQLLWTLKLSDEKDPPSSQPVTNGAMDAPSPSMEQDTYESPADQATLGVNGAIYHQAENSEPLLANGHRAHDAGSATSDPAQSREDPVSEAIESKTFGDGHATSNPNGTAVDISTILRDDEDAPILDPTAMDPGRQGSLGRLSGTINGSTVHAESYEAEVDMYLRSPSVEYVAY